MRNILLVFQFSSAVALVVAVLLHAAKGEGMGSIGGTARIFASQKGLEEGLNKVTTILGAIFLVTSAFLGFMR